MGLSGTGQLHDLFITVEGMTSGEYKNGGMNLSINYSFATTPFGDILISSTPKRIYSMEFVDNHKDAFNTLQDKLSKARYYQKYDTIQQNALLIFTLDWAKLDKIKLYLKGTEFQMKVWETLLKIPMGGRTTYGDIAAHIGNPHARHAVGTAVGENPVTFLIPCHRVVRATREIGNYHWGGEIRKASIIGWEAVKKESHSKNE